MIDIQFFHQAYDDVPIGICLCSADGVVVDSNPAFLAAIGKRAAVELSGQSLFNGTFFTDEQKEMARTLDEYTFKLHFRVPHTGALSGEPDTIATTVKVKRILNHHGDITGYIAFLKDSHVYVNDPDLAHSVHFHEVIDNLDFDFTSAKLILDEHGRVTNYLNISGNKHCNQFYKRHGFQWGKTTLREMAPETCDEFIKQLNEIRDSGEVCGHFLHHFRESDEFLHITISFESNEWISIISLPVTSVVKSERTQQIFVQNLSHDIRTPLNAIVGFSELLASSDKNTSDDEKQMFVKQIRANNDLINMLFEDILNLTDVKNGNLKIDIKPTECNSMCKEALMSVSSRYPREVSVFFDSNVDNDYLINTDRHRVQQILTNYLTNACKHTYKGSITLRCDVNQTAHKVTLSVIDTGEGVPEDIKDNLFERFVKHGLKDSHGIGLNICYFLAQKLNASVSLDTSYTSGAKFDLTLPL